MSKKKKKKPEEAQSKKLSRPLNRLRIGSLATLQLVLLSVLILALNYLSLSHFERIDLSRDQDYSL